MSTWDHVYNGGEKYSPFAAYEWPGTGEKALMARLVNTGLATPEEFDDLCNRLENNKTIF